MRGLDRRSFLRGVASLVTVGGLAGCPGTSGQDGDTTPSPRPGNTPSGTPTGTPSKRDRADLKDRARAFVRLLDEGRFEAAHDRLSPLAAGQISPDQLEQVWSRLVEPKGDFRRFVSTDYRGRQDGYDVVVVRARFARGSQQFNFAFDEEGVAGFRIPQGGNWSPPEYVDESSFAEQELALDAPGECSLGATLTLPDGNGDVPGVVLVHGNGPQDRDETVGPNKTFKDLAWGLATQGIAVLRYDKRTRACDVDLADVTIDEVVTDDALTAVERIRGQDRIPNEDVVVVGHSIGGTLAPRIAARDGNLAGIAMLAPLARSVPEAIVDQTRHLVELDGEVTDAERKRIRETERLAEKIRTGDIADDEVVLFGGDEYWETFRAYDPLATATGLDTPRLILQGERDWQVTVDDDLTKWRAAIGDQQTVDVRTYENLNHHFMPGEGTPTMQEYFRPNNVSETVVTDLASWIDDVTGQP